MPITLQQLIQILPSARSVASNFVPARIAAFLAQVGHESGQLRYLAENLNCSEEAMIRTWPPRVNGVC